MKAYGQISISGDIWSAKTTQEMIIEKGTEVEIIGVDGVKVVVVPCKEQKNIEIEIL